MPMWSTTGSPISSSARASRCWRWRASACSASATPSKQSEQDIIELSGKAIGEAKAADAVLISCGGLMTLGCAEPIEQRHGIPVVTSTQSAFWKALRLAGDSGQRRGPRPDAGAIGGRAGLGLDNVGGLRVRGRLRGGGIPVISALK